jgi:predicted RNase H-like nuclease (RuvC/YqgF family)
MGKGGKRLQNASQEIKELQEYNHELQNQVNNLDWTLIQKKNLIDHMVDKIQLANDLRDQIEMKDQLIDALQIKLREKWNQIDDMIDATSAANQRVDASCDPKDLIEQIDAICDTQKVIQKVDTTCDTN